MPNETDPARHYTDREVRLILKTAVEMQQQRADRAGDVSGGMSLVELEQVAVEAGLDPALVRHAAARLDTAGAPTDRNVFLGSPTHIILERVVELSIDPDRFDQLLDVVRAVTHEVGEISTVGRQFGWKGRMDGAKTEVNVSAGERRSTLRVRVELDEVAVEHFMLKATLFGFAGGLFGTAVTMSAFGPVGIVVGAGTLATGYLWARRGLRSAATRYRARAHELIDAIATRARDIAHGGSA